MRVCVRFPFGVQNSATSVRESHTHIYIYIYIYIYTHTCVHVTHTHTHWGLRTELAHGYPVVGTERDLKVEFGRERS